MYAHCCLPLGSDIWALGCLLYQLLACRHPFQCKSLPEATQLFGVQTPGGGGGCWPQTQPSPAALRVGQGSGSCRRHTHVEARISDEKSHHDLQAMMLLSIRRQPHNGGGIWWSRRGPAIQPAHASGPGLATLLPPPRSLKRCALETVARICSGEQALCDWAVSRL